MVSGFNFFVFSWCFSSCIVPWSSSVHSCTLHYMESECDDDDDDDDDDNDDVKKSSHF